jgi:hypothetical protein
LLVSSTVEPPRVAPVPGVETSDVSMEPAYYTGTVRAWETAVVVTEVLDDRTIERWPTAFESKMTDARVNGLGRAMDYLETIKGPDGTTVLSHTGVGRLTTDDGSWAVECHGAASGIRPDGGYIFCWYEGEAAYDGLTAFKVLKPISDGVFEAEGWIFPGERPPLLEFEE